MQHFSVFKMNVLVLWPTTLLFYFTLITSKRSDNPYVQQNQLTDKVSD